MANSQQQSKIRGKISKVYITQKHEAAHLVNKDEIPAIGVYENIEQRAQDFQCKRHQSKTNDAAEFEKPRESLHMTMYF